jgi:hypothetical protein
MPSKLPRLNVVMTPAMREWLEAQRMPCESASHVVRRLVDQAMQATPDPPANSSNRHRTG